MFFRQNKHDHLDDFCILFFKVKGSANDFSRIFKKTKITQICFQKYKDLRTIFFRIPESCNFDPFWACFELGCVQILRPKTCDHSIWWFHVWESQYWLIGVSDSVGMEFALCLAHGRAATTVYNIQSAVERETCASALWLWWAAGPPAAAFWIKTSIYLSHLHVFVSCFQKSKDSRTLFVGVEEKVNIL